MSTTIVVTPGETALINALTKSKTLYITDNLLVGDIHIKHNGQVVYIFERKAKQDLDASIKDGRYREQKVRLLETGLIPQNIVFIIEQLTEPRAAVAQQRVWSAMCNSHVRDRFSTFQTKSVEETAQYIAAMAASIDKHYDKPQQQINVHIKKKRVDANDWYKHCLMLIHGVSEEVANCVVNVFPSFKELNIALKDGWKCIADLKRPSGRKVGKKLAQTIADYCLEFNA